MSHSFIVAMRTETFASDSIIGSPYWMAPEVIKFSGITTASDIWSLGALTVELFTTQPPFYFLEPMAALFRIVNDATPPFPKNLSYGSQSFLLSCFVKNPEQRASAMGLTRNTWFLETGVHQGHDANDCGVPRKTSTDKHSDTNSKPHLMPDNFGTCQRTKDGDSEEDYSDLLSVPHDFDFLGKLATLQVSLRIF